MGKQHNRVTVPEGPIPGTAVPGTTDDLCHMNAMAAYDRYYSCLQKRYGRGWSERTFQTDSAAIRNAIRDIGQLTAHRGWDPEHFIETALSLVSLNHTYVTPGSLLNRQVVDAYSKKVENGNSVYSPEGDWHYYATQLVRQLDPAAGIT